MSREKMQKKMQIRNERIKKMYKTGKFSTRKLAQKVGLGKSRIHEIVSE